MAIERKVRNIIEGLHYNPLQEGDLDRVIKEATAKAIMDTAAELDKVLGGDFTLRQIYDGLVGAQIDPLVAQAITYHLAEHYKENSPQKAISRHVSRNGTYNTLADSLEGRIQPIGERVFTNEVLVEEGSVMYLAKAWNFEFSGDILKGFASLTKSLKGKEKKKQYILSRNFPFFAVNEKETDTTKYCWSAQTNDYCSNFRMFFILNGKSHDEYRKELIGNAANQGITLSPQLMSAAFSPIDAQVMKMYRESKHS